MSFKLTLRQYETLSHMVYAYNYLHTQAGFAETENVPEIDRLAVIKSAKNAIHLYMRCIGAPKGTVCKVTGEGTDFTIFSIRLEYCDLDESIREENRRRYWFNANVGEGEKRGVPVDKMKQAENFADCC